MANTHRILHRSQILIVLAIVFAIPLGSAHAQFYDDGPAGITAAYEAESANTLQQDEEEQDSIANAFAQMNEYIATSQNTLKQEYGSTAFSSCYQNENTGTCLEDATNQVGATECMDTVQSCLENSTLSTESTQTESQQGWQPSAIPPLVLKQAMCLLSKNAQWNTGSQTCDCLAGYQRTSVQTTEYTSSPACTLIPAANPQEMSPVQTPVATSTTTQDQYVAKLKQLLGLLEQELTNALAQQGSATSTNNG